MFLIVREYGRTNWITAPDVLNEDFDVIRGLDPGKTYTFRVVAVDGEKSTPSEEQEILTYAVGKSYGFLFEARKKSRIWK